MLELPRDSNKMKVDDEVVATIPDKDGSPKRYVCKIKSVEEKSGFRISTYTIIREVE